MSFSVRSGGVLVVDATQLSTTWWIYVAARVDSPTCECQFGPNGAKSGHELVRLVDSRNGLEWALNISKVDLRFGRVELSAGGTVSIGKWEQIQVMLPRELLKAPVLFKLSGSDYRCIQTEVLLHGITGESEHAPQYPETLSNAVSALPVRRSTPIRSIPELLSWNASSYSMPCCDHFNAVAASERCAGRPSLLVCHDMRGGYSQFDTFPQSLELQHINDLDHVYKFTMWSYVDIFVYFSHYFITIPPTSWIRLSHLHGALALGTIITEHEQGKLDTALLIQHSDQVVSKLVDICKHFSFDGWLLNFETDLPCDDNGERSRSIEGLFTFVEKLVGAMHHALPGSKVIWYDAVSQKSGQVEWKSRLDSQHNTRWFMACDGLFTDYKWKDESWTMNSSLEADKLGRSSYEVFTGIDVFGRGTNGGFETAKSLKSIQLGRTSTALFAQGWTFENAGGELFGMQAFDWIEKKFWLGSDVQQTLLINSMPGNESRFGHAQECWDVWSSDDSNRTSNRIACNEPWALQHDERYGYCWVSGSKWSHREQIVDLASSGWSEEDLDARPTIFIHQRIIGTGPDFGDKYRLQVHFVAQNGAIVHTIDTQVITATDTWQQLTFTVSSYPTGVRSIIWHEAAKDAEYWGGHFGCRLGPAVFWIMRRHHPIPGTIADKFTLKPLPIGPGGFISSFNAGIGKRMYQEGKRLSNTPWVNLGRQEATPIVLQMHCSEYDARLDFDNPYNGGSSLEIILSPGCDHSSVILYQFDPAQSIQRDGANVLFRFNSEGCIVRWIIRFAHSSPIDTGALDSDSSSWKAHSRFLESPYSAADITSIEIDISRKGQGAGLVRIGYVAVTSPALQTPSPVQDLSVSTIWSAKSLETGSSLYNAVLSWKNVALASYYDVYDCKAMRWLGTTLDCQFTVTDQYIGSDNRFRVQAVSRYGVATPLSNCSTCSLIK